MRINELGTTGLKVTELCVGTSPLGGMPLAYGYDVAPEVAQATLEEVFASPIGFLDTSNEYSGGESERRIGAAIRARGTLPDGFVLATKIDPLPGEATMSADRVDQSFRESTERLGLDTVPLLYLHDPVRFDLAELEAPGGAIDRMVELRDQGLVGSLGVADGDIDTITRLIGTGRFDVVLNHNRFTLADRSAEALIRRTTDLGLAFVNAAPFGSGILAKGPAVQPNYEYRPANATLRARVVAAQAACAAYDVELAAAALQFSTRDPRIASTVVGISKPGRVASLIRHLDAVVPDALWAELDAIFVGDSA